MRKKRKLAARAAETLEIAAELETPEIVEALAAHAAIAESDEADDDLASSADEADDAAAWAEPADVDADAIGEAAASVAAEGPERLSSERLESIMESLLFAGDRPLSLRDFKHLTGEKNVAAIEAALASLSIRYEGRGIVLHDVAGGFQFRTQPLNSAWVQRLIAGRPVRLSRAQLETLAIIAYRQPITRPEIDEIRGVDSGSTLKILMDRDLIRVLGKREEVGRPLIYGTTREFLEFFHLKDLRDLPTLREFHELSEDSLRQVARLEQDDDAEVGTPVAGDHSADPDEAFTADQSGDSVAAAGAVASSPVVELDDTMGPELGGAEDVS